ncbi:MAG: OmpA family protein [Rhodospirillales bacterium]|nr:OmpA family protein [Rhodospirillales bacterium]
MTDRRGGFAKRLVVRSARAAAVTAIGFALAAADAAAQGAGPYYDDESVVVDLSVIDDGGFGRPPARLPPAGVVPGTGGPLQMPGTDMPRSRFYGLGPPSGRTAALAKPPAAAARTRPATAPKTAAAPARAARAPVEKRAAAPAAPPSQIPAAPPPPPVIAAVPPPSPPAPAPAPAAAPATQPAAPPSPPPAAAAPLSISPPAPPSTPGPVASIAVPPPAAPAAPPAAPAAQAPPPSQAALPLAPAAPPKDRALQIAFPAGDSRLPAAAHAGLKELAERMKAQEGLRLQLVAYAGGGDLSASAARRLSLSRALAVRTFLIENGVRSTRIDVRALGDKVPDQPANRVDLSFSDR